MECSPQCRSSGLHRFLISAQPQVLTTTQLGDTSLPDEQPEMIDDDLLKALHHVLLEVSFPLFPSLLSPRRPQIHIEEGQMTCPNCNHVYPISNGIPNMVRSSTPQTNLSLTVSFSSLQNMKSHSEIPSQSSVGLPSRCKMSGVDKSQLMTRCSVKSDLGRFDQRLDRRGDSKYSLYFGPPPPSGTLHWMSWVGTLTSHSLQWMQF